MVARAMVATTGQSIPVRLFNPGVGKLFWVAGQMSPRQACRGPGWKKTSQHISLPITLGKQILFSPDRIETTAFTVDLATLA